MTKQQAETKLSQTILETWNRVRSSDELQSLIARRALVLETVEDIDG
ncbi:MAG: hypothetical protein WBB39_02055 [Candidatus Saccharimonadales bacterium]|nr:hypothetical protein [Candidatus Saccharibacteria bacterium]